MHIIVPLGIAFLALVSGATAQGTEPSDELRARVAKVLGSAQPLDADALALVLDPREQVAEIIFSVASAPDQSEVRDRASAIIHVRQAVAALRTSEKARALEFWLALNELHRIRDLSPEGLILTVARPDAAARDAAIRELVQGRAVADRFCSQWNEWIRPEQVEENAALEAALKSQGLRAVPRLFEILSAPPEGSFWVIDPDDGITARQQVRALNGIHLLGLKAAMPYLVLHVRSPSLTAGSTAAIVIENLSGMSFGSEFLHDPPVEGIRAWWAEHGNEYRATLDHLVRGLAQWGRTRLRASDPNATHDGFAAMASLQELLRSPKTWIKAPEPAEIAAELYDLEWRRHFGDLRPASEPR